LLKKKEKKMSPEETLSILYARLETNAKAREIAASNGDIVLVQNYDNDTATTLATINKLKKI
jgi:hypothetical protein